MKDNLNEIILSEEDQYEGTNIVDDNDNTTLHILCRQENPSLDHIKILLEKGADIHSKDDYGNTPLHIACMSDGNFDLVKFLVEKGADLNATDNHGWTPLHIDCSDGNFDIVKFLIEKGANINAKANNGWTPLYRACIKGNLDLVKLLVEKGANLKAMINDVYAPLWKVCLAGKLEAIEFLVEKGADLETTIKVYEYYGASLLSTCIEHAKHRVEQVEKIRGYSFFNESQELQLTQKLENYLKIVKLLLIHNADINIVNRQNETPLELAKKNGLTEIVSIIETYERISEEIKEILNLNEPMNNDVGRVEWGIKLLEFKLKHKLKNMTSAELRDCYQAYNPNIQDNDPKICSYYTYQEILINKYKLDSHTIKSIFEDYLVTNAIAHNLKIIIIQLGNFFPHNNNLSIAEVLELCAPTDVLLDIIKSYDLTILTTQQLKENNYFLPSYIKQSVKELMALKPNKNDELVVQYLKQLDEILDKKLQAESGDDTLVNRDTQQESPSDKGKEEKEETDPTNLVKLSEDTTENGLDMFGKTSDEYPEM